MHEIELSKLIRKYRKQNGYTQHQVAEMIAVTDQAVSSWECGKYLPDIVNLMRLCKELSIPTEELVESLEHMIDIENGN